LNHLLYDAHLHLQDRRLDCVRSGLPAWYGKENVARIVVNGTQVSDWPDVLQLAEQIQQVLPSFGIHPWWIENRPEDWLNRLIGHQESIPSVIGEIGLDRWFKKDNMEDQVSVFLDQWHVANERGLPVTIHCLKAWGTLLDLIEKHPHQGPGFLLHSYSGPLEMVDAWVKLGARFSISGHFAHPRKASRREVFHRIPLDRILIETDAPDMPPPEEWVKFPLPTEPDQKPINHPGNLISIYDFAAKWLEIPQDELESIIEHNFREMFGMVM
jgi:TatD DNase family protein